MEMMKLIWMYPSVSKKLSYTVQLQDDWVCAKLIYMKVWLVRVWSNFSEFIYCTALTTHIICITLQGEHELVQFTKGLVMSYNLAYWHENPMMTKALLIILVTVSSHHCFLHITLYYKCILCVLAPVLWLISCVCMKSAVIGCKVV